MTIPNRYKDTFDDFIDSLDTKYYVENMCYQKIYSWYSYIYVNTEYILYILYFCWIVIHKWSINHWPIHILLSRSFLPYDKSYIFLSLVRNSYKFGLICIISKSY